MWFRLSRVAVIFVLCVSLGAHWAALQSVAWATMIVEYSHHASLAVALAQTFDGNHPCGLCKGISAAKHEQKKTDGTPLKMKFDLICATRTFALRPRDREFQFAEISTGSFARVHSPATPPPRAQLA